MPNRPAEQEQIGALETDKKALDLRKLGLSYDEIAKRLGIATGTAFNAVKRSLKRLREETKEPAEEVRELELNRIDLLLHRAITIAFPQDGATVSPAVKLQAIDRVLKCMERRAKLLGLDSPDQSELKLTGNETLAELVRGLYGIRPPKQGEDGG